MKKIISSILLVLLCINLLAISSVAAQPSEKLPVIIKFNGKADAALIRAHGGDIKYEYTIIPAIACSLPQQAIEALQRNPAIAYIEEDMEVHALSEEIPWGVDHIEADLVQYSGNEGTGVKIAIIDTGIDYTHPDLRPNYMGGYDFVNNDADPRDDNGHGTHCAGIAAAASNDLGIVGVAPAADLFAVKVLNRLGNGYVSTIISGINWCVDNNIQIASMSLGGPSYSQSLEDTCDAADNAGLVLVASAGNSGDGNPDDIEYSYPAAYDSVIAVGATDQNDDVPSWSNSGDYLELAAPGVGIYSTLPTYRVTLSRSYGYDYGTLSGTSMACPHVAGVAALVFASGVEPASEVKTILRATADDLGNTGRDYSYGYGLVDADEAAGVEEPSVPDSTPPIISAVASSEVTSTTATITWETDEPSDSLVNYGTSIPLEHSKSDNNLVTSHSVTLTDLTSETKYYFEVRSTDASENTATAADIEYQFTTDPAQEPPEFEVSIVIDVVELRSVGRNTIYQATATITITDSNGPIQGATVSGNWEGATNDYDTGITDDDGIVKLTSNSVKSKTEPTFIFAIYEIILN